MDEEMKKLFGDKWEEMNTAIKAVKDGTATKAVVDQLILTVKTQGQEMAEALERLRAKETDLSFEAKFEEFLNENQEKLQAVAKAGPGSGQFIEFNHEKEVLKVVGDMTTGSGGDVETPPVNHNTRLNRISLQNNNPLIAMCNIVNTKKSSLSYTETIPKEGGYEFVAEGAIKPKQDFKWEVRYANPFKIAAYQIFSEEVVTDIPRLMSVASGYLKETHDLFKVDAVYFADGTGIKPTGATVLARVFNAGAMALKVVTPTMKDIVSACITDIYITPTYVDEAPFRPRLALLNPVDFFVEMQAVKDADGHPLFKGITLFDSVSTNGVTIAPWYKIPAGKIFVGDMSKMNLSNYVRYSVRIGWINDQLITNEFTMVGESRYHQYVENLNIGAFIYDDYETIRTAITKP